MFICEDRANNILETFRLAGRFFKTLLNLKRGNTATDQKKDSSTVQAETQESHIGPQGVALRAG